MEPIEEKYREKLQALGLGLDLALNGEKQPKETGFVVLLFGFGDDKRMNYISNANREDMLSALKELIAIFEGRAVDYKGQA